MQDKLLVDEVAILNKNNGKTPRDIFKEICQQTSKSCSTVITQGLVNNDLILKLETVSNAEIAPLKLLMKKCFFERIILQSDEITALDYGNEDKNLIKSKSNSRVNLSSASRSATKSTTNIAKVVKTPRSNEKSKSTKLTKDSKELESFFGILSANIKSSPNLSVLKISGTKLTVECLQLLAMGIRENTSLREVFINYCDLTTQDLDLLYGSLANNTNINVVDLSKNRLDDQCGMMIGKIISSHAEKRDQIIWVYSIRGDKPDEDIELKGLCDLNISYNQLGSNVLKDLCYHLQYDTWVRNLNVRGNKIDDMGVNELARILEKNNSLFSVDLRDNPFFNPKTSKRILAKLTLNIQNYKSLNFDLSNDNKKVGSSDIIENEKPLDQYLDDSIKNQEEGKEFGNAQIVKHTNTPEINLEHRKYHGRGGEPENIEELINKYHNIQIDEEALEKNDEISFGDKKHNLYHRDLNLNNGCENCRILEKKLLEADSKLLNLQFENFKLKKALNTTMTPNANMVNSWSGIAPTFNDGDQNPQGSHPQTDSISLNAGQVQGGDEMFNKIEYLMGELTRMMDSLESINNNVTNNFTGHFTNSTNLTNNNTYQLINSVNNINFNTTYTNILNSNNNSRLNNPNPATSQQNKDLILQSNQLKENSKSFSRSSNNKKDQNPNDKSDNAFSPRDKSENLQSQAVSQFSLFFRDDNSHINNSNHT
jgi:hypothetical protein